MGGWVVIRKASKSQDGEANRREVDPAHENFPVPIKIIAKATLLGAYGFLILPLWFAIKAVDPEKTSLMNAIIFGHIAVTVTLTLILVIWKQRHLN